MIFLELFLNFFFIGITSIGGGLSTIPLMTEILTSKGWVIETEILDMIAISEMTPGPIGINMATYAGNKAAGILGGISATAGLVAPSVIIIIIIAHFYNKYRSNLYVNGIMTVVRPVVTGMIAAVCANLAVLTLFDVESFTSGGGLWSFFQPIPILIAAVVFIAGYRFKVHPVLLIVSSAIAGIILM
ncbi:MAG: chromate transporter [Clostridia bacterium]|nr:chromate transporter [Clostridia bacterium]MBN2883166.1 chromate transporter [Clostridia bacterium]